MQNNYELSFPGKTVFGNGSANNLPDILPPGARILLVTGKHAACNGLTARLEELLSNFKVCVETGIQAEPPLPEVDRLINRARNEKLNTIVAVGGGSVIDAAKAAAAIAPSSGMTADFFYGRRQICGKGLFFAALPTTSGTGAEITPNSVLTDPETKIKKSLRHHTMFADAAIVDPELTYSCPAGLTAASGFDALTQAVESYISRKANPVSSALAGNAAKTLFANLVSACENPDPASREAMASGSMMAAMAFVSSGLGAVHGVGHPIGSILKVPHGVCCAILLHPMLKWNLPECREQLEQLAIICGAGNADKFIEQIAAMRDRLKLPADFSEYGLTEQHFEFIVKNCRSGSMLTNPRHLTDNDVITMLEYLTKSGENK